MGIVIGYKDSVEDRKENWYYLLKFRKNRDINRPRTIRRYEWLLKYYTKEAA